MDSNTKRSLLVTVVGVTLFVALLRFSDVLAFAARLVDLVLPILAGGILALFINVPMTGLEKRLKQLFRKAKKQPPDKTLHLFSFFLTLVGIVLVLVLALTLLVPELVKSFHSLYLQIESNIPRWTAYLSAQDADMGWLMHWLEGINWEQLLHKAADSIDKVLVNAVGAVSATVNVIVTASFALIISVYLSLGTESLGRQAHTLVCAYLKPRHAAGLLRFCRLFRQSFANFLTGQCSEAVILGVLMAFAFSAAFAGLAGGLYACYLGVLDPSTFGFMKSIEILVMVVLGGMGSMLGSILSATVLTILPEATRSFDSYRMVIYSLVLILMMIFRPGGLLGSYDFSVSRIVEKVLNGELFRKKNKEGADHE